MADLTVTFPAGAPMQQCVPFIIIDDNLAREGNETFQFTIDPRPGVHVINPETAEVTIIENDLGKLQAELYISLRTLFVFVHRACHSIDLYSVICIAFTIIEECCF